MAMMVDPSATNPGPIDPSVLYDQEKHVSSAVWDGQERGALRCHEHTSKLGEWRLSRKQVDLVEKAGFGYLRKIPAISLDNPLISALVERWRRETNTFHLTLGEMTVTLQDVALLLGLAIDGKPVIGITYTTCSTVCQQYLGRAPDSNYASGGMVKLSWLKEFFSLCPEDASAEEIERHTRAYLLYLVGSTIFSTTTGNKVPVMYLPLFEDFEEAGKYAWGAAALAFLYRALGNASVKSQSTICGCLTLLQCWSYYHLNIGRPKLNRDPVHDQFPFVLKWKGKQSGPTTNRDVVFYRKALDSLKTCDVEWLPYKYVANAVVPDDIRETLYLGRSKTMLICFDKAERHLPDRCLRQYGSIQRIPENVVHWVRKSRGVDGGVDLSGKMEPELNEWADRQLNIVESDDDADEEIYMQWYLRITRKVVGRPISLSSEFQRTISGLREISYLTEIFPTKGLDPEQYESISRIRCIAQECLRDQVGVPVIESTPEVPELGKRTRGKERVRRNYTGKRKRGNDPMEGQAVSEEESHYFGPVVAVDPLHFHEADGEEENLPLCATTLEGDTENLYDVHEKPDEMQLDSYEVNNSHLVNGTNGVNNLNVPPTVTKMAEFTQKLADTETLEAISQSSEQLDTVDDDVNPETNEVTSNDRDSKCFDLANAEIETPAPVTINGIPEAMTESGIHDAANQDCNSMVVSVGNDENRPGMKGDAEVNQQSSSQSSGDHAEENQEDSDQELSIDGDGTDQQVAEDARGVATGKYSDKPVKDLAQTVENEL